MSFLHDAAAKVPDLLTEDLADRALERADRLAADRLDEDELADAREGLAVLEKHKGALVGLARGAAAGVLVSLAAGDPDGALDLAGVEDLTFEERRALHHASTDAALAEGDARKARRAALKALAADLGTFALTKLLPFLLAAL